MKNISKQVFFRIVEEKNILQYEEFDFKSIAQCEAAFRPTIDPISVIRKNILQKLAGSLKKKIPTIAVPAAPIPVQTAYAVPIGRV